jgi:hypothetical protein
MSRRTAILIGTSQSKCRRCCNGSAINRGLAAPPEGKALTESATCAGRPAYVLSRPVVRSIDDELVSGRVDSCVCHETVVRSIPGAFVRDGYGPQDQGRPRRRICRSPANRPTETRRPSVRAAFVVEDGPPRVPALGGAGASVRVLSDPSAQSHHAGCKTGCNLSETGGYPGIQERL